MTVIVTGICGNLGKLVARRLHREYNVVGLDRRPFPSKPKDIELFQIDIRRKKAEEVFRKYQGKIKALVHLGIMHDPRMDDEEHHTFNLLGTTQLLEYCSRYKIPKVVLLSSANVYGPRPDNAQFLSEDTPLLGSERFHAIRDLVAVDMIAQSFFWKQPEVETVILRPVHIVGPVNNAPSNYLRLKTPPTVMGFDPMVQLIHAEDVVEAIAAALKPGSRGIFNITGPGELPLSEILRRLGRKPFSVPYTFFKSALRVLWRWRMTSFPYPELDHIRYVCMVDGNRAKQELGFSAQKSLAETILAAGIE
jgi:UDP-glucose 4-epimerase